MKSQIAKCKIGTDCAALFGSTAVFPFIRMRVDIAEGEHFPKFSKKMYAAPYFRTRRAIKPV